MTRIRVDEVDVAGEGQGTLGPSQSQSQLQNHLVSLHEGARRGWIGGHK